MGCCSPAVVFIDFCHDLAIHCRVQTEGPLLFPSVISIGYMHAPVNVIGSFDLVYNLYSISFGFSTSLWSEQYCGGAKSIGPLLFGLEQSHKSTMIPLLVFSEMVE